MLKPTEEADTFLVVIEQEGANVVSSYVFFVLV